MTHIDDGLTIIVPTIGRPSLQAALESIKMQMDIYDQVFVIGDGILPAARKIVSRLDQRFGYFELPDGPHHDWGAEARNFAIPIAKKAYLAFMDDDDLFLPGAFHAIKTAIRRAPGSLFMFRMKHGQDVIWRLPDLSLGNVSIQMAVVPNDQSKLARFTTRYEGDFDFLKATAELHCTAYDPFIWCSELIAVLFKANGKPNANPIPPVELPAN